MNNWVSRFLCKNFHFSVPWTKIYAYNPILEIHYLIYFLISFAFINVYLGHKNSSEFWFLQKPLGTFLLPQALPTQTKDMWKKFELILRIIN